MKDLLRSAIDSFFNNILSYIFYFYEKHLFFRIRKAYGKGMIRLVKNRGIDLRIHGRCTFIYPDLIKIGNYVRIGHNCYFFCIGGIKIGNNTQISRDVTIYASNHNYEGKSLPYDLEYKDKKGVIIEDNVWIGMGVFILPGVTIGEGAIIGMNTVVTKNVEKYAIIVGAPQKKVGERNIDKYKELQKRELWFGKIYPNA